MKSRLLARALIAVLGAGVIQVLGVGTQPAQAAPVTCTTSAMVFSQSYDGTLSYYEHLAPATGAYSWAAGRPIGAGFTGTTLAGGDGWIYFINQAGEMRLYRYDGQKWENGAGALIGTGWGYWELNPGKITIDSAGRIFTIDDYGNLRMFRYDVVSGRWAAAAGQVLDVGWDYRRDIIAAGDNVLYSRTETGQLLRYRYDPVSQRWTDYARVIGNGFDSFTEMFSAGGDTLYGIGFAPYDMYWYRFDADTGTWANGGVGRLVGNGWHSVDTISAISSACTVPAPAPVPPSSPQGFQSDLPTAGSGTTFAYFEVGDGGHAFALTENGSGLTRMQIGTATFATDLATTAMRPDKMLAGVDATGTVRVHDWRAYGTWRSLAGSMVRVQLGSSPSADSPTFAIGTDVSGQMWWRREYEVRGDWTGWRPVPGLKWGRAAGLTSSAIYGVGAKPGDSDGSTSGWFVADINGERFGTVPRAAEFTTPTPAENWSATPAMFARHRFDGRVYALFGQEGGTFDQAWTVLPPLDPAQPAIQVGPNSLKAVQGSNAALVVTAVGGDMGVYVTSQKTAGSKEFHPWQRIGTQSVTSAGVTSFFPAGSTDVAFQGDDGRMYHYVAKPGLGDFGPLVFTGGGHG